MKNSIDTSGDVACSSAGAEILETASVDGLGNLFWQTIRKVMGGGEGIFKLPGTFFPAVSLC
jgi:hypothetical protein